MSIEREFHTFYDLLALPNFGSILHTAAHPDDEDTGLLTYFSAKYGIRTTYWCATRGESGMNRISQDQGNALGVIRSWEAEEAGAKGLFEYAFGPFRDFGFSYTASEGFTEWNGVDSVLEIDWESERVTREIVRQIRSTRPLIVVSRWSGAPKDFHGQHQTVGIATIHAFQMAGNPDLFKDLEEEGLPPWQPLKLYVSVNNPHDDQKIGGALNSTLLRCPELESLEGVTWINTGEYDPYMRDCYQKRAWESFNSYRSQSVAQVGRSGDSFYYYKLIDSKLDGLESPHFLEGIGFAIPDIMELVGIADPDLLTQMNKIYELACQARDGYQLHNKCKAFEKALLEGLKCVQDTLEKLDGYKIDPVDYASLKGALQRKEKHYYKIICECFGIHLEAISSKWHVVNFGEVPVTVNLWNYSSYAIKDVDLRPVIPKDAKWEKQVQSTQFSESCSSVHENYLLTIGGETVSAPYWLVHHNEDSSVFEWPKEPWVGKPLQPDTYQVTCEFTINGVPIKMRTAIVHHESVGVGQRTVPLRVIEPISIEPLKTFLLVSNKSGEGHHIEISVIVRRNSEEDRSITGNLFVECPEGCELTPESVNIHLEHPGDVVTAYFKITSETALVRGKYRISCRFVEDRAESSHLYVPVRKYSPFGHNGDTCLDEYSIRYPAEVTLSVLDIALPVGMNYGLVPGQSNEMFSMLNWEKSALTILDSSEAKKGDLSVFDAIIIGPNAYVENHLLQQEAARFLEYVHRGGVLIVMFQRYDYATPGYAPYRFSYQMPHNRLTDHNSPISILTPEHPLFQGPNQITMEDFEGWKVDRGVYFWNSWDSRYLPLLRAGDPGEKPHMGGMMYTRYGQGAYLYVGYSLHRQILAGVDGAFRIFANILDLPKQILQKEVRQLQAIPLFEKISSRMLEPIAEKLEAIYLKKGEHLEYGMAPHQMLCYLEYGLLEKPTRPGEPRQLIEAKSCFGEASIFLRNSHHQEVVALEDSLVLVLSIKDWWSIIQKYPSTVKPVLEYMAQRRLTE